jgi:hypothetical protein
MNIEFIRVYNNGLYVVAEFQETDCFPVRKFPLNAESIKERIRNREKYGLDTVVERMALGLVRGHKDYRPAAPAEVR